MERKIKRDQGSWTLNGEGPCREDEGMREGGESHGVQLILLHLFFFTFFL